MTRLLVTQRVIENNKYAERRDGLDQRWNQFFLKFGYVPILLPNNIKVSNILIDQLEFDGILLTGGNSLSGDTGLAPERDELEHYCIERAITDGFPILGVCRGMQVIQTHFGATLSRVTGHVNPTQRYCSKIPSE